MKGSYSLENVISRINIFFSIFSINIFGEIFVCVITYVYLFTRDFSTFYMIFDNIP